MKLSSTRSLDGLKSVLQNPASKGQDPVYWVFSEVTMDDWVNMTVIAPGKIGQEYPKTFGHYHPDNAPCEIYHLIESEGVLLLQKKYIDEMGRLQQDSVAEVILIKAKPGDEIIIKKEYGHSWSNVGHGPLISFDNWRIGHTPSDYEVVERLHGMAYYLIEDNGQVKAVPNSNYKDLPEPIWLTAKEFKSRLS